MAGLKIGFDESSLNSLKTQLATQIDNITKQKVLLGVDIDKDTAINQLKGFLNSLNDISKSNNPTIDLQVNNIKAKEDLVKIKGDFKTVVGEMSKLGMINVSPKFDDKGKLSQFTIKLQQLNGLVDKIKYNIGDIDASGNVSFMPESINEINNLDKISAKLDAFKTKYSSFINDLKSNNGINDSSIKSLQNEINSLNINNFEEKSNQIKKTYSDLSKASKEYINNLKLQQSTQNFIDQQQSRLNNVKNNYGSKLDINSSQYKELENTYNAINSAINRTRETSETLSKTEQQGLRQSISDLDKKQSKIVSITNVIKQQEQAINSLKTKFGNMIPDNEINKLKNQAQGLFNSGNLIGDNSKLTDQINKIKELGAEQQRLKNMGTSIGSFSTTGINMESSFSDIQKYFNELNNGKATVSSVKESVDSLGNTMKTVNYSVNEGKNIVHNYKATIDEGSGSVRNMSTSIQDLSSRHATLGESMQNAIAGFLKFQLIAGGVMTAINSLKEGIQTINALSQSITNIAMVTGDSIPTVEKYMQQYTELSKQLHTTTTDIATAAEEFLRAGNTQNESMQMVKASTVMAKEAGMSADEASQGLIAVSNSYGILPNKIMSVVDAMTTVDNKSATSVSEINNALQKTSSSAKEAGVPLQDLISYIAQISSTTRISASSIGSGLNSIFSRYQSIKMGKDYDPDNNDPLNNVEKSLNSVGISIRKNKDEFKSFSDVIDEVGKHWSTYTGVQKNLISTQLAGTYQRNQFNALMSNYNNALKLQESETKSAGSAMQRYGTYAESTQAKLSDLKGTVQRFWQETISSNTINSAIGSLNGLINGFSEITNKIGVIPTLLTGILPILTQFGKFKDFKLFDFTSSLGSMTSFGDSIKILGVSLSDIKKKITDMPSNLGSVFKDSLSNIQELNNTMGQTPTILERTRAGLETVRASTIATTIATGVLKVAEIALNAALTMGLSVAIGVIISKLTEWINKDDELAKKNQDLINSTNSSIQQHQINIQSLSDMSTKYKEVSDRIDSFRKAGLQPTASDMKSLGEMNDQIAQKIPNLVSGYDSQGHAILNLNGNLKDLIEQQKEAARWDAQKVINNSGFKDLSDSQKKNMQERINHLQGNSFGSNLSAWVHPINNIKHFSDNFADEKQSSAMVKQLQKDMQQSTTWYKQIIPYILQVNSSYSKLNPTLQNVVKNWANANTAFSKMSGAQVQKKVNDVIKSLNSAKVTPLVNQIQTLNNQARAGAVPLNSYTKNADKLINEIKKITGNKISTNDLKKLFDIDTSKLPKSASDIQSFSKSVKDLKNDLISDQKTIQQYQNLLDHINKGGLTDDDKKIISEDPNLAPYLNNISGLTDQLKGKIDNVKNSAVATYAEMKNEQAYDSLNNLVQTYEHLSQKTNLNSSEQKTLNNTMLELAKTVQGVTVVTDANGKMELKGIKIAQDKATSLGAEGKYLQLVAQVGQAKAKADIDSQQQSTNAAIDGVNKRISAYKQEIKALESVIETEENSLGGKIFKLLGQDWAQDEKEELAKKKSDLKGAEGELSKYQTTLKGLNSIKKSEKQGDADWQSALNNSSKAMSDLAKETNNGTKATEGYTPAEEANTKAKKDNTDATDANTQATKLNEEMQKKATQAVKEATNVMKAYEDEINKVQLAIKNYDYTLGTMNDHSDAYIATLEKKKKALQEQLQLTNKNIAANNANAASLKNMATEYSGVNYAITSSGGSSSGSSGTKYTGSNSFIGNMLPYANSIYKQYGIPPSLLIAQAMWESTSGTSYLARHDNNYFGMTWTGHNGKMGSARPEGGHYVHYDNMGQSVEAYAKLLAGWGVGGSFSNALNTVVRHGYAADGNYRNAVNGRYRQYNLGQFDSGNVGGTASISTGLVSGEDAANTAQSGYESLLSQVESLQQSIPDLKAQIDQVAWSELEAKEGQFDDKINSYAKFIEAVKTKADMYNEGSKEKVEFLKQEWQDMNVQYNTYNAKQKFIENQIQKGGWNSNYIQQLQSQLIELKATEQQALQTLQQAFDDWITADYQAKTQIYQDKLDTLQQQYDLLDTKDKDNYQGKLDIAKEELEQQLKIKAAREDELNYVKQLISNEKYGTTNQVWLKEQDTINKDLLDTNKNIADIENTIADLELSNKLKSYENDITNLKAKLQELDNVTDKGYNDKIDIINKIISDDEKQNDIISKRIKLLQDEANRFADGSEEKIELLDQVNTLEQKQNDIQQDRIDQYKQLEEQTENQVLDLVEKQIYGGQTKQEFEDAAKARENAIDAELKAMDKQEQNLQEQETRDKNLLDLEEARVKLQQDQNERNVQQLTQDKNGNWNWTYVANQTTVDQDEKDLRDKQTSNNDWERQTTQQHQQDTLNDEKEQLEQEVQIRQETMDRIKQNIEDAFNDQEDLFSTGQTDINKIVTDSLSQMENLYGSTFGNITSTVSSSVQSILSDISKLNPNFVDAQNGILNTSPELNENPTEQNTSHTIYGSMADLENAKAIYGTDGYNYVDISKMSAEDRNKIKMTSNDRLIGGDAVTFGIDPNQNGGSGSRLWGQDRNSTKEQIAQDAIDNGGTYVIVGSGTDLVNAKTAFGDKYRYIPVDGWTEEQFSKLNLRSGDLVVDGQGITPGLNLNGATRLGGANRQDTAKNILDYSSGEMAQKIKVYATGADYQNAIKTLDSSLYDVIDTAKMEVDKIQLNAGDKVVGGGLANQLQGQIQQSGATAIYGKDRNATLAELEKFKKGNLSLETKYDQLTTQQKSTSTTQQTVIVKDAQTNESYAINVGANTNLATVTQSMSNINDVTYNGMGQMVVTVQDNVNQAIDAINQLLAAQAAAGVQISSGTATQIGNVDTRPVVFAKGSDAAILKAQYGDSINIQYGTGFSGRAGTTRYDTNKTYQDYLSSQGVVPINKNVDLSKFDTGGYTGDWAGDSGKLAVLHKKEMILNPNDTENFMILVKALEEANIEQLNMPHSIVPFTTSDLSGNISNISNNTSSTQEINVYVDKVEFPDVKDSDDIVNAFTYKLPAKVVKMQ